jgi:hypothetical protein
MSGARYGTAVNVDVAILPGRTACPAELPPSAGHVNLQTPAQSRRRFRKPPRGNDIRRACASIGRAPVAFRNERTLPRAGGPARVRQHEEDDSVAVVDITTFMRDRADT